MEDSALSLITTVATLLMDNTSSSSSVDQEHAYNSTKMTQMTSLYSNKKRYVVAGIFLVIGVFGNSLALWILSRKRANKNTKYTLMLRWLSTNNLIGLVGVLITVLFKIYLSDEVLQHYRRIDCVAKVFWRFFGVASGCIAAIMAIERWMALARPFIYHKHITYELVRKTIISLVLIAIIISFMPIFGFGAYIDESDSTNLKCMRYRDADGFWNTAYSVLFMLFGTLLCVVIVACNLFVTRVLCFIGRSRTTKRCMNYDLSVREKGSSGSGNGRIDGESHSGTSLYQNSNSVNNSHASSTSPDEIKFAKLMAFLSISFVICWMPQMIAIPLAIKPNRVPKTHPYFVIADTLMTLHFTSDPYVYVLSRTKHSYLLGCIKRWRCSLRRSYSNQSRSTIEPHTVDFGFN